MQNTCHKHFFVKIVRRAGSCDASYRWGRRQGNRKKLS